MASSHRQALLRHRAILKYLAASPLTLQALRKRLRPAPSERTLATDFSALRDMLPGRFKSEYEGRAKRWRFIGDMPFLLEKTIHSFDEDQITALIAARGILRQLDPSKPPAEDSGDAYHGVLSGALDRLLDDQNLADEVRAITPDAIAISRFGVAPEEEAVFPLCLAAIRRGDAIGFTYTNLDNATHDVHAQPVRLVHIAGEWHCLAWAPDKREKPGKMKQYRLSRMTDAKHRALMPTGCPVTGLRAEAMSLMRDAFRATGSTKPADRRAVVLAISPQAWPFIERRRWGADQKELQSDGLPQGWRRIRFVTTGLREAQFWVMSFGASVRAEAPVELVRWVREQAQAILNDGTQDGSVRTMQA